jgi:uncharacterized protein
MDKKLMIEEGLVCEVLTGSHAYGTNIATSDTDTRGIFVAPEICIRTPFFTVREVEDKTQEDTKYYELTNFMKLLVDQNPNILELLWVDDIDIMTSTPIYNVLRSHRSELLSSKLAYTFSGYAISQLKRIKGHNKWINNPQPIDEPLQKDYISVVYNMTDNKLWNKIVPTEGMVARDLGGNMYALYQVYDMAKSMHAPSSWIDRKGNPNPRPNEFWKDSLEMTNPDLLVKVNVDQYKAANTNWGQYWDWKKHRNVQRSVLEEQFGYDTKHAMHLVRLLRMGKEALETGVVLVKRPDAKELLDIRNGKWIYEDIVKYAEGLEQEVKAAYETTDLRRSVDVKFAANLLMALQDMAWRNINERPTRTIHTKG